MSGNGTVEWAGQLTRVIHHVTLRRDVVQVKVLEHASIRQTRYPLVSRGVLASAWH